MSATARRASAAPAPSSITAAPGRRSGCGSRATTRSMRGWPIAAMRSAFTSARIAAAASSGKATAIRRPTGSRSAPLPTRISRRRHRRAGKNRCIAGSGCRPGPRASRRAGREATTMIDTLAYAKHLEENGFERRQAEALAQPTNRYIVPDLATKQDLQVVRQDLTNLETRLLAAIHTTQFQSIGVIAALIGLALAV